MDFHETVSRQYEESGKALSNVCKCGSSMAAIPKQNGYTWTCNKCGYVKFEKIKRG